jgi:hypothetical protein
MAEDYTIHLNFFAIKGGFPTFRVYRKLRTRGDTRPSPAAVAYTLPIAADPEKREVYWVQFEADDSFDEFLVEPQFNFSLNRWALYQAAREAASRKLRPDQFVVSEYSFHAELSLVMREHQEGQELLVIQPYYLRITRQFGLLVDFHFRLRRGIPFSRRIQQLSLSLNKAGRRNLDYYIDRSLAIVRFARERKDFFSSLYLSGSDTAVQLQMDYLPLPATRLRSKSYVFAGGRESRSQFNGLREFGPLHAIEAPPHLLFAFREQDRHAARTLAMALRGSRTRERFSFPGFATIFKSSITFDANPIVLTDFSSEDFSNALARVKEQRRSNPSTIPVFVLPEGDDNGYHAHKAVFAHEGIPTQVCTLPIIQDENALKWAIANIALQIFCKAGGQPWKVRPTAERSLILGISQSHRIRRCGDKSRIDKYFAFSVLTDNSGLFQRIQVLGDSEKQAEYLTQIRKSLQRILIESPAEYRRVVIHTSFRLKQDEMAAIESTVAEAMNEPDRTRQFAVVKVNHKCRFFGINRNVNSLVPYEASILRLGGGEYLLWFEGIFPDKPTVTKAFPGPTHLEFLRVSDDQEVRDDDLLQDLVNLSGANWRGFNAKSAPISVFFCHLVADMVHDFHERGLPLPSVQDVRPWFL